MLADKHRRSLDLALKRFNSAFTRREPDDSVVDLAIALEASLAQGKQAGLTKELQLRSVALVGRQIPNIHERMGLLYKIRGKLVHHGHDLGTALRACKSSLTPKEYLVQVRGDVRTILSEYLSRCTAHGKALGGINEMLDDELIQTAVGAGRTGARR